MIKKMRYTRNKAIFWLLAFLCLAIPASSLNAIIDMNGSGHGFNPAPPDSAKRLAIGNTIEAYVVEAAGYYLQAQADITNFSSLYETAQEPVDYSKWQPVVTRARANLQNAQETYSQLIATAKNTPYNMTVIEKLKSFDYKGFAATNRVNSAIFGQVEAYLKAGDITGLYKYAYEQILAIDNTMMRIEYDVQSGRTPAISDVWAVNDGCDRKLMLGQYVANIFYTINKIND